MGVVFLKMGQHGVTGWWPVIFAMLAVFCPCLEKVYVPFARIIYRPKTIQVLHFILFFTSLGEIPIPIPLYVVDSYPTLRG